MSEENPPVEPQEDKPEISNETYEYMLSQLTKEEMISLILKSFKPGNPFYEDFMEMASNDKRFYKIFVFDMSYNVTEEDLRTSFEKFGKVTEVRVLLNENKKSKGCGFVKFESPVSALKAFESDVIIDGRPVLMKLSEMGENAPRFRKAVPKEKEKEEEDQGPKDSRKIHVNGFPLTWKNEDMENFFKEFGELEEAFVCFEKGSVRSRGFGFVTFRYKKDYEKCLLTPVIERDGFTITCSKVSKTSESRLRRNRYDDGYRGEKRDRYDDRRDDHYYGYNSKEREVHDYHSGFDKRNPDPYYQDTRGRYDAYNYPPPTDYPKQSYYPNYPPSQPYQGNDYIPQQSYPPYQYGNQHPPTSPPNGNQPPNSYDQYSYPPSSYSFVCFYIFSNNRGNGETGILDKISFI